MKNIIVYKALLIQIVVLLVVSQFWGCSEEFNIKIVNEDDSSYVHFDSLSFFPKGNIDFNDLERRNILQNLISDLYITSDRGRIPFEYVFYINEEGEYEKVLISKSLNEELDKQFVNFKTKSIPGKGKINDRVVKYKTIVNNKQYSFPNWSKSEGQNIQFITEDDTSYMRLPNYDFLPLRSVNLKRPDIFNNVDGTYKVLLTLNKMLFHASFDLKKMERKIIGDLPFGYTDGLYELYVGESGQLEKIRIINSLPYRINELFTSFLPTLNYPTHNNKSKYKVLLQTTIVNNYPGKIVDIKYSIRGNEKEIKEYLSRKDKDIEIIQKDDNTFKDIAELDNVEESPMSFHLNGAFPILNVSVSKELQKFYDSSEEIEGIYFLKDSFDEFRFTIYINTDGLVEKVKIDHGHGEILNEAAIYILKGVKIWKGKIASTHVKFKAKFKLRISNIPRGKVISTHFTAFVINPLFRKSIHELPEKYTENDFLVLPDENAQPIGGYVAIAEKIIYPELAIRYKQEGEVSVKTYIDEEGEVVGYQLLKAEGYGFDDEAVKAIKDSKFKPAQKDGKPIKSIYVVPIEFTLNSGEIKIKRDKIDAYQSESQGESIKEPPLSKSFDSESIYFVKVENMPKPIGGVEAIQEKLKYPNLARSAGVEGRVFVRAYIGLTGNVEKTEILKGIGAGCDEEAMKAIKETKFIPGRQKGKIVKVQVSIPVLFSLESAIKNDTTKHLGKWVGKSDRGEEIKLTFHKNGFTDLYKSRSGRMNGVVTAALFWPMFKISYSSQPHELDLLYVDSERKVNSKRLCIFVYESPTKMKIGTGKEFNRRPKSFAKSEVGEIWKLEKTN